MPDRHLYPPVFAAQMVPSAGKRYRPSNGTEGEAFYALWCADCRYDINENCPVYAATLAYGLDDPDYSDAWQYGADGQPLCDEFDPKEHETSDDPNQLGLFAEEVPHA